MIGKDEDRYRSRLWITRQPEDHKPPTNSSPGYFYRNRPVRKPVSEVDVVVCSADPADADGAGERCPPAVCAVWCGQEGQKIFGLPYK